MSLSRRSLLSAIPFAAAPALAQPRASRPPNIIVILADDQGYGDLGCQGSPHIRTPHIDRMAREGARLTSFYAQPLCGPSRAALLTGCYPVRNSLMFNHIPRARTGIHPNEVTLAELLKQRGYATAMLGKWHLGDAPPFRPHRHGFDSWFGLPYSNDMWPFHPKIKPTPDENPRLTAARARAEMTGYDGRGQVYPTDWFPDLPLMHNDEIVALNPDQSRLTGQYTERALGFIRDNRAQPFFLYLAHNMPHAPLFPGAAFEGRSARGRYGDCIEEIDDSTGRILDNLRQLNLDRDTFVVYTSDNGPWAPYGIDAGSAGPLRGAKGTVWEGGIRVPAVFWSPGRIPAAHVTSEMAATIDLLPTAAALSGAELPTHTIDGRDMLPLLTQPNARSPHEHFYYYEAVLQYNAATGRPTNHQRLAAIRNRQWKLNMPAEGQPQLYDLLGDVSETTDRAAQQPALFEQLKSQAVRFDADLRRNIRPLGTLPA